MAGIIADRRDATRSTRACFVGFVGFVGIGGIGGAPPAVAAHLDTASDRRAMSATRAAVI